MRFHILALVCCAVMIGVSSSPAQAAVVTELDVELDRITRMPLLRGRQRLRRMPAHRRDGKLLDVEEVGRPQMLVARFVAGVERRHADLDHAVVRAVPRTLNEERADPR